MRRLLLMVALALWPQTGFSQDEETEPALLIADEILVTRERDLIASGNVEAYQGTTRLRASEVRYNRETGALTITGPIVLEDADGVVILADAAELDTDLRAGLLLGAQMVLDQRLQLSAVQAQRVNERYSQLYRTTATSCRVCEDGRPPLWQIRASRVIHDRVERQLYFEDAQFRIRDVPVFYLPRLRLPDPTVERATGFLFPTLINTSEFGTSVLVPYFFTLGDHRDLTVSPYISDRTRTLNLRYRQAFRRGRIEFEGAVSRDDERPGATRGYLFGNGSFSLPRDFGLSFGVNLVSDTSYLQNYDITDDDRLTSFVNVSRTRRSEYISGSFINYESLRNDEVNDLLPTIVGDGVYRARYFPSYIGGEVQMATNAHLHYRTSDLDIDGRDVSRFNVDADWMRSWTFAGLRSEVALGGAADLFNVVQDSSVPQTQTQVSPRGSLTFRYPLAKTAATGASLLLEPLLQVGWVGGDQPDIPNEESTSVEFDAGNLLSLSRFPAPDRRERGATVAYGVNWSRFDPNGWDVGVTLGQVLRDDADPSFAESSGLSGTSSDVLFAGQVDTGTGITLSARTLLAEGLDFNKAEFRGSYGRDRLSLSGTYIWLTEETGTDSFPLDVSEFAIAGAYGVNRQWYATFDWRYDLEADRASELGAGLAYTNECVTTRFSFDRTFSTSSSLEPSTTFSVTIGVRGFAAHKGTETYTRSCGT